MGAPQELWKILMLGQKKKGAELGEVKYAKLENCYLLGNSIWK